MLGYRRISACAAAAGLVCSAVAGMSASSAATASHKHHKHHVSRKAESKAAEAIDVQMLTAAAEQIQAEAIAGGALPAPTTPVLTPPTHPVRTIALAVDAMIHNARHDDPSRQPVDTRAVMGSVPMQLRHHLKHAPHHRHITATHTLNSWRGSLYDRGAGGVGANGKYAGALPALFQKADGVYVDPHVPAATKPTISEVAIRAALKEIGQPYVWAAAGPKTFDCSGLAEWAYAKAGIWLEHYTGYQWNEGRRIPGKDILPGDLVLYGDPTHHVGIYLGAGWMVNAPYMGQYVDVVPLDTDAAGVIRP